MAQQPLELILLRQAAEALDTAVVLFDAKGDLVYYNEAAAALTGLRLEDQVDHIVVEEFVSRFRPLNEDGTPIPPEETGLALALRHGLPVHKHALRVENPDGTVRFQHSTTVPLQGAGGVAVGVMQFFWPAEPPAADPGGGSAGC